MKNRQPLLRTSDGQEDQANVSLNLNIVEHAKAVKQSHDALINQYVDGKPRGRTGLKTDVARITEESTRQAEIIKGLTSKRDDIEKQLNVISPQGK